MSGRGPAVSVLLAVHNGGSYLPPAVESILGQSLADFELLVVDDGSTDETTSYLSGLRDPRLVVIRNEPGLGQTRALNRGLEAVRAPLVARMDGDDIAEPERLGKQLAYLQAHPEVTVLGTAATIIDGEGATTGSWDMPALAGCLTWHSMWRCPLCHPSVMMRTEVIRGLKGYDPRFEVAQDYDLWARVLAAGGTLAVLPERLMQYRRSAGQMTARRKHVMEHEVLEIACRQTRWALNEPELPAGAVTEMLQALFGELSSSPEAHRRGLNLTRQVTEAVASTFSPEEAGAVRDFASDALVYAAEAALAARGRAQARAGLLAALRYRPRRTLRPRVLRSLLATCKAVQQQATGAEGDPV